MVTVNEGTEATWKFLKNQSKDEFNIYEKDVVADIVGDINSAG